MPKLQSLQALFLLFACVACGPQQQKDKVVDTSPNLLFILTDEMRYDTSAPYGNTQIKTPHLNRLGEESLVFEKTYVTQPVCSPARSSIMTGFFPHKTTVTTNNIPLPEEMLVLPARLPDSFATSFIGKWHLGYELDIRAGFDERISTEDGYTSDDTTRFSDYHFWLKEKGYTPDNRRTKTFSRDFCNRLPYEHTKSKFTEIKAIDFLERNKEVPFALYLSFLEPHTPNFGPFDEAHNPKDIQLDSTYGTFVPEAEPLRHRLIREHHRDLSDREELQLEMAKYWGLVHQVDKSVGVVLQKLEELGLEDQTIVLFTSEHGKMMGKFGLSPKRVMYEASTRIPLFIRIPHQAPANITFPVSQIDLVPTLMDALGLQIPNDLHGRSLLPHLGDDHSGNVFIEWHPNINQDERYPVCPEEHQEEQCHHAKEQKIRTIVTPTGWKLCKSVNDADVSQLFNLNNDPLEINNLYYDENFAVVRDSLVQLIREWQVSVEDPVTL